MEKSNLENRSYLASAQDRQSQNLPWARPNPEGKSEEVIIKRTDYGIINLRCADPLKTKLITPFGVAPAIEANKMSRNGRRRSLWLSPDESLLLCNRSDEKELTRRIGMALQGDHHAITVLSDAYSVYHLKGPKIRDMLAKGCSLDLHESVFIADCCAQTALSLAGIILACEARDEIILICRTSFSDYLETYLKDASIEYGYQMTNEKN